MLYIIWTFRESSFDSEVFIIVLKQSDALRVSDTYRAEEIVCEIFRTGFTAALLFQSQKSQEGFLILSLHASRAPSISSHRRRLPTRLPTESSVHRELENGAKYTQAKHNRGTRDAMRLAYAHVYRCRQRGEVLELHVG